MPAPIAIIMGSQSDWETMGHAAETLSALGIDCEKQNMSNVGRPIRIVDKAGVPISEVLA